MDARIQKQRTELVLSQPFFGALALRLNVVEDPTCETFWTDSVSLGYNPTYAATLSDLEVRGVLAHEVLHVANGHCWRMGSREPDRWNDAADYAINPIALDAGFVLPRDGLNDPKFAGRSAEEIYAMLGQDRGKQSKSAPKRDPNEAPGKTSQKAGGAPGEPRTEGQPSSCGEVRPYPGGDIEQQEARWKVSVIQATKAAQMRGALSGDLEAMAKAAVAPRVDWRPILHRFAQASSPTDFSWKQPNRRYLHLGLYLPSLHETVMADAVFVRDSSGSVFDETQAQFDAEIVAVNDAMRPERLVVMDCDTRVTRIQIFERGEAVVLKPVRGGGGTSFVDPFKRIEKEGIRPAFLAYLTDMAGTFPDDIPSYPVLWASTEQQSRIRPLPSFGEIVEVLA